MQPTAGNSDMDVGTLLRAQAVRLPVPCGKLPALIVVESVVVGAGLDLPRPKVRLVAPHDLVLLLQRELQVGPRPV